MHYTSAEAALKIIKTKRLWMRNATCMADYREVNHGFDIVVAALNEQKRREEFIEVLDGCVPGVAVHALTAFDNSSVPALICDRMGADSVVSINDPANANR